MRSTKSSKNLYWLLISIYFYLIFSISRVSLEKWDSADWWLFIYMITLQVSTVIAIEFITYYNSHNSKQCVKYKLHLHKLFEQQKDNLDFVKIKWFNNAKIKYAKEMVWTLYSLAHELNIEKFQTGSNEILARVEDNSFFDYLHEKGFHLSSTKKIKNKKWIKNIKKQHIRFLGYEQKFDYALRDYLNGILIKSFDFSNIKIVINFLMFLFPFSISIYCFIIWDYNTLFKLLITFGVIIINIIVAIPETKEMIDSYVRYWSDIEIALIDIDNSKNN